MKQSRKTIKAAREKEFREESSKLTFGKKLGAHFKALISTVGVGIIAVSLFAPIIKWRVLPLVQPLLKSSTEQRLVVHAPSKKSNLPKAALAPMKESAGLSRLLYRELERADREGLIDLVSECCEAFDFPVVNALTILYYETTFGKNAHKESASGARGLCQILPDTFLERFCRYDKEILAKLKMIDLSSYEQMKPYVGRVSLQRSSTSVLSTFRFNTSEQALSAEKMREKILALRDNPHISLCVMLAKLSERGQREGLRCHDRLVHNWGDGGARIIEEAWRRKPNSTMYEVVHEVYRRSYPDKKKRESVVQNKLKNNGLVPKQAVGPYIAFLEEHYGAVESAVAAKCAEKELIVWYPSSSGSARSVKNGSAYGNKPG